MGLFSGATGGIALAFLRMKRKQFASLIVLLVFAGILWRGAYSNGDTEFDYADVVTEAEIETETKTEPEQTEYEAEPVVPDIQSDIALILEYGTQEFYCGYPVDEAFFCWVAARYGDGTIKSLAGQLCVGNTDPKLWYQMTENTMHVLWMNYCKERGFSYYEYENVIWKDAGDPSCIKLDFVGDINFDDTWYTMQAAGGSEGVADCISEAIRTELQSADVTMVNNEFTYTTRGEAQEDKEYCFRADPENVSLLELFGTDIVSVANNHVFDYGEEGFTDTLATLRDAGIVISGGGENLSEASAVKYFVVGGRKIAIVSATEIERYYHYTRQAEEDTAGVLKTQQEKVLKKTIRTAAANSDYVITYIHWGEEGKVHYGSDQKKLAEVCVKAGADAVIGGHPHRMQGVSFVGDTPVVYSLGNNSFSTGTLYTTIAQIQIDRDGELTLRMLPCIQKDVRTDFCKGEDEMKEFYHYLADISSNVGIDEEGYVYSYHDVNQPGISPYAYTSGRKYGLRSDDVDLDQNSIDIVGNTCNP
jgi:poly-gamma-glutamate synthesis protein (capsule biosynthesis protein)